MELNQEQKELAEAMAGIVAGKTAAELVGLTLPISGRVNYFRAAETLLYNYKSLEALLRDRSGYIAQELPGRSAGIVLNAGQGQGSGSMDEMIGDREAERARLYELTAARFDQVDRVVQLFNDRPEFKALRMYYFGENEAGQDRGVHAERYTWEEIGVLLGRDAKTLRRWRNRIVKDMAVCWFGVAAAVSSAVAAD